MSLVVLRGVVRDVGTTIELADGRILRAIDLATDDGPINLIWDDDTPPDDVAEGEEIVVIGSLRRRFFRAGGRTVGVTEVVVDRAVRVRRQRVVDRALQNAFEREASEVRS